MTSGFQLRGMLASGLLVCLGLARAEGEAANGFPNWNERVLLEWTNRARSDPQVEMTSCGPNCGDAACYIPVAPLPWNVNLAHSARFHDENMAKIGFFAHDSACTLVNNIATVYPATCDASAACSCVGGVPACNATCTVWSSRIAAFGSLASGENLGSSGDPNGAFYQWLYEPHPAQTPTCQPDIAPPTNIHRWNIFKLATQLGAGQTPAAGRAVLDFGGNSSTPAKIPSGSHYPRQATSVDAWVNWYDTAAPSVSKIDVDGVCTNMNFARGAAQTNGAWMLTLSGVGAGCHRYFFAFKDSTGKDVLYPTNGSLTIGDGSAQCPDWSSAAPAGCAGFDRIFANGLEP